jgi:hypothetical protein
MRLRQFIIDEYEFNLDLETWGLTSKAKELKRFERFIPPQTISKSNALFGYHGDKYYFDVDIRRHFGLDKYDSDVIPYWKTETLEAMDAFRFKDGYTKRAGECVSLSALYAAAAFIVCGIPLEDIYMVLTPLHSQNFIDIQDGVLTNNRRLVTRAMWFNGTAISNKAQRALRNENVTIVAHSSGYVHCMYDDATIDEKAYRYLAGKLGSYLSTDLTLPVFASFLRTHHDYQKYFQLCRDCRGQARFLKAETLFHYEHSSNFRIADATHEKLLADVSDEDFAAYELPGRIRCDQLEDFISTNRIDPRKPQDAAALQKFIEPVIPDTDQFVERLVGFMYTEAKLPGFEKSYLPTDPIEIPVDRDRQGVIEYLQQLRTRNTAVDLAFYAYRDMQSCDWRPFVKAAVERNPVSIEAVQNMSIEELYNWLGGIDNVSIYDGQRLAQPDEVANYNRGDGLEKAFLMANVIRHRSSELDIAITAEDGNVVLHADREYRFVSAKGFAGQIDIASEDALYLNSSPKAAPK